MTEGTTSWVMMTVHLGEQAATLSNAAKIMNLPESAFDADFGLTVVDREKALYAVMVDPDAMTDSVGQDAGIKGPFSNPKIEPFS
ncbi:MAG: hypothetical protein GY906_06560 [bacterium]|nr:hypothetical protein [bacterium]